MRRVLQTKEKMVVSEAQKKRREGKTDERGDSYVNLSCHILSSTSLLPLQSLSVCLAMSATPPSTRAKKWNPFLSSSVSFTLFLLLPFIEICLYEIFTQRREDALL